MGIGAILGISGVAAMGRNRTPYPRPLEDAKLVQTGPYRRVRHPLYACLILLGLGWSMVWNSHAALALAGLLALFFDAKARLEERFLGELFPEYADYRQRVRRLLPWIY